jgi:hypothetical protein
VEAVIHELVRSDILPYVASRFGVDDQAADKIPELMLCSDDLLVSMQERREHVVMMPMLDETRNVTTPGASSVCRRESRHA